MALKLAVYVLIGLLFLYLSNHFLNSKPLSLLFLIAVFVPILFLKLIMKRFTREILIDLKDSYFSIVIKKQHYERDAACKYNLNELSSYSIQFPAGRFSSIILNLKNGKSVEYSFINEKKNATQINTEELMNMFHDMIKNYNSRTEAKDKITFKPSFIASRSGLICLTGLISFFVIAGCLHALYQVKTLPVTLILGFVLTIQLISKRKADLDYYKMMN